MRGATSPGYGQPARQGRAHQPAVPGRGILLTATVSATAYNVTVPPPVNIQVTYGQPRTAWTIDPPGTAWTIGAPRTAWTTGAPRPG